ncbi:ribosome assembly factor SBDS [Candidatus Pacearchaeota archaeon]|nr:ribosome assembly factor SBDS [Candidatus Pacearchaeota archaeon]
MTDTIAKLKVGKLDFETMVNMENALKLKKGEDVSINDVISDSFVYTDQKKGMKAGKDELLNSFNTEDFSTIVEKIVKKGEIEITKEFRDEALENRKKQVVEFLSKNAVDARTRRPFTPDMISSSISQAGVKIENQPVERQIKGIIDKLKEVIPIKLDTKKIKVKIPAQFTGQIYGLIQDYKEKEEWEGDGSLGVTLNIPSGLLMEFYDKLNKITHGAALSEELKE